VLSSKDYWWNTWHTPIGPNESKTRQKQTRDDSEKWEKKKILFLAHRVRTGNIDPPIRNPYFKREQTRGIAVQKRDPSVIVRCSSVRTNVPEERRKPIVQRASRQESFQAGFSFDSNRGQSGPGDAENTSAASQYSCEMLHAHAYGIRLTSAFTS